MKREGVQNTVSKNIRNILTVLLVAVFCLSGCSSWQAPKEGTWYCEELRISIDFSYIYENRTPNGAKLYAEDGSYTDIWCHLDYGRGIFLMSQDQQVYYLSGEFRWRNNTLTVTAYDDGTVYTFVRIDPLS